MMTGSKFSPSQEAFVYSTAPFPAFVGGVGSGKTAAAIARIMRLKRLCPMQDVAYYLPTFPLVEDIAFQRFPALFERNNVDFTLNRQKSIIQTAIGSIRFRSMDTPDRIIGYEVAHSICDELDTLPTDKARNVWNKIIARNRQKAFSVEGKPIRNTVAVATTPEGFRFTYDRWVKNKAPGYEIYKAKTMDNAANLPDGYIENLEASYPSQLLSAYLYGEFVNLTAGSVYPDFDRKLNGTFETIEVGEPLHVGMDFNVNNMTAVVSVLRGGEPLTLDELTGIRDTPVMCQALKERFEGHRILVYPDASGNSSKSVNASVTDLAILRQAGFSVVVNPSNPRVKDRVLSLNRMIHADNKRRWKVNPDRCPVLVEALERQAYDKNGEPDKKSGFDHCPDALGYFIAMKYPVHKPVLSGQIKFN